MTKEEIGSRIKTLRKKALLTQEQLGTLVGVSRVTVNKWEKGEKAPALRNVRKLAALIGGKYGDYIEN